jgi:betaine-aldehyde dehydrogenase
MTVLQGRTVTTSLAGSWIDGAPVVTGGGLHQVINPASGQAVADYALAAPADVDRAVASARAALSGWAAATPADRSAVLAKLAVVAREPPD